MTGALIVTALLDPASQVRFDDERHRYFPAPINFISAHVTLFHALPGAERESVVHAGHGMPLAATSSIRDARPAFFGAWCSLRPAHARGDCGAGKAGGPLARLAVAAGQAGFLATCDGQNKVSVASAHALLEELQGRYAVWRGEVSGLLLWQYEGGPWTKLEEFRFEAGAPER